MCELTSFRSGRNQGEHWVLLEMANCPGKSKGGGLSITLKKAIWDSFFDTGLSSFLDYSQLDEIDFSKTDPDETGKNMAETIMSFINDNVLAKI